MDYKSNNELDLIEKYFSYELNEEELAQFDQRYQTNEQFKVKVTQYEMAKESVDRRYYQQEQKIIEEKRQELAALNPLQRKKTKRIQLFQRFAAAAAILVLVGIAFWLQNDSNYSLENINTATMQMAQNTVNLDPIELNVRSSTTSPTQNKQLWEAYQAQQWKQVISLGQEVEKEAPILLLQGIAHFHLQQYEEALQIFQTCKNQNNGMKDNILWWLASTHLKQQQTEEATTILQEIIEEKYPSAKNAKELLMQLEAIH